MFKKNTAVTGFGIGHFINATTGAAVTTGTPTCKRTIDGTGGACANAASYNTDGAAWEIDLAAGDMNGDTIILSFTLTDCLPIAYTIKTVTGVPDASGHYPGDVIEFGGTAVTGRDIGASVLLSAGTGTGQIALSSGEVTPTAASKTGYQLAADQEVNVTKWGGTAIASANVRANLTQILGSAVTEGAAGRLAAAFTLYGDVATPVFTAASVIQTGDLWGAVGFSAESSLLVVDIGSVHGDVTAASNLEKAYDGTGYNVGGGSIVAASVTAAVTAGTVSDKTGYELSPTGVTAVQSGLALEATLTAIKGATWNASTDTLEAIRDKLPANLEDLNITDTTGLVRPDMANASGNYSGTVSTVTTVTNSVTATLADDAITAAKFDESTAFPLKAADAGATYIARTGADSDTLETLSDQMDVAALEATLTAIKGATFNGTTDSLEAIRDRGDAAWVTATGFATHTAADVAALILVTPANKLATNGSGYVTYANAAPPSAADIKTAMEAVGGHLALILDDTGTTLPATLATINGYVDCLPASWVVPAAAGDAMALTSGERNSLADVVLGRSVATCETTAAEWSICTLILAALESSISGTIWTVKRTDGTTTHATKTLVTDSEADPVTGVS